MTTTFRLPKLACGFALAASLGCGADAWAQRGMPRISAPRANVSRGPAQSRGPSQTRGPSRPSQPGMGLTDPGGGGNPRQVQQSARPSFTNSARPNVGTLANGRNNPWTNGTMSNFAGNLSDLAGSLPAGGYEPGYAPQDGYDQQGYYPQQPQQGYYQQQPQQTYDPQYQQTSMTVPNQRFQIPAGYEAYTAGTTINYGGASYTATGDGTMTASSGAVQGASQPAVGQRFQVPTGYEAYTAGATINYGGAGYVINGDGTMTAGAGAALSQPAAATSPAASTTTGPVSGQRYQIPAQYANSAPGSIITYVDHKYILNNDATMTAIADQASGVQTAPAGPTPGQRYQIPAEFANSAAGSVITYAGYKYLANTDKTMTAFSDKSGQP